MNLLSVINLWPPFTHVTALTVPATPAHYHALLGASSQWYVLLGASQELYDIAGPSEYLNIVKGCDE